MDKIYKRINRLPEWAKKQRSECFSKTNYWKDRTWRWKVLYARCPGYNHQNSWVYGKLEKINNKINISAKRLFHKKNRQYVKVMVSACINWEVTVIQKAFVPRLQSFNDHEGQCIKMFFSWLRHFKVPLIFVLKWFLSSVVKWRACISNLLLMFYEMKKWFFWRQIFNILCKSKYTNFPKTLIILFRFARPLWNFEHNSVIS